MYRLRTYKIQMRRWMLMDCHPTCLKGDYEWEDLNLYLKPHMTGHRTSKGFQPHALTILAANSLRLHIGKLGVSDGEIAFERARNEIMSLENTDEVAKVVRVHLWRFFPVMNSIFFGPMVSEWSQWERSEATERGIISKEKARLRCARDAMKE